MANALPHTFKNLIPKAKALCDDANEILKGKTAEGFIRLVWTGEQDNAIDNISEMIGTLKHAVSTLASDSKAKKKYDDMIKQLYKLREQLRES